MPDINKKQLLLEEYIVDSNDEGIRVDRWFQRHHPRISNGIIQKLLRTGQVRINGKRIKANNRLLNGDSLRVPPLQSYINDLDKKLNIKPISPKELEIAKSMQDQIIYKDDSILAINKPPGIAVQGGKNVSYHIDRLLEFFQYESEFRPRLVHRLDRDTSGILILARNPKAAADLGQAFQRKEIKKIYWALVVGVPKPPEGCIETRLKKTVGTGSIEKTTVNNSGKRAITLFRRVESSGRHVSFIVLQPETGRNHQLRVHCSQVLGCPILGDGKYGGKVAHPNIKGISNQIHLHARSIRIPYNSSKNQSSELFLEAPLPKHIKNAMHIFGFEQKPTKDPFQNLQNN